MKPVLEQIFEAKRDPKPLDDLLKRTIPLHGADCCHLVDVWRGVDRLITGGRSQMGIRCGDESFTVGMSDPAHALFSTGTRRFAARLDAVAEEIGSGPAGPRHGLTAEEVEDLLPYFDRLHAFVRQAVREGRGLVFCTWEGF